MSEQPPTYRRHQQVQDEILREFIDVLTMEEINIVIDKWYERLSAKAAVTDFVPLFVKRASRVELRQLAADRVLDLGAESEQERPPLRPGLQAASSRRAPATGASPPGRPDMRSS